MTVDVIISTRFPIFVTDETPGCATVDYHRLPIERKAEA